MILTYRYREIERAVGCLAAGNTPLGRAIIHLAEDARAKEREAATIHELIRQRNEACEELGRIYNSRRALHAKETG